MADAVRESSADLKRAVETYRRRALQEHEALRNWMTRALVAEARIQELETELRRFRSVVPQATSDGESHDR